jgi:hypothetical protein
MRHPQREQVAAQARNLAARAQIERLGQPARRLERALERCQDAVLAHEPRAIRLGGRLGEQTLEVGVRLGVM